MFTIKAISNGREFVSAAVSFELTRGKDCDRLLTFDKPYNDGNYVGLWAGKLNSDPRASSIGETNIYVMNRDGATIANYRFSEVEWSQAESLPA